MRIPFLELQTALFDRIKLDQPTYAVYTFIPGQNTDFPYVAFGQFHAEDDAVKDEKFGGECSYVINIWSQNTGTSELAAIINGVVEALTRDELILSNNWRVYSFFLGAVEAFPEAGNEVGSLQHAVIRPRVGIEDTL